MTLKVKGVIRTLSNIYHGAFFVKTVNGIWPISGEREPKSPASTLSFHRYRCGENEFIHLFPVSHLGVKNNFQITPEHFKSNISIFYLNASFTLLLHVDDKINALDYISQYLKIG